MNFHTKKSLIYLRLNTGIHYFIYKLNALHTQLFKEGVSDKTGSMKSGKYFAVVLPILIAIKLLSHSTFLRKHSIVDGDENIIIE
jgi:hypothetical protein